MERRTSSRVAPGWPMAMLSPRLASKTKPSWGTIRMRSVRERGSTSGRGTPPTVTEPSVGSARRDSSLAKVVLPEPVSPTMATLAPAGMSTSTSLSTGPPVR